MHRQDELPDIYNATKVIQAHGSKTTKLNSYLVIAKSEVYYRNFGNYYAIFLMRKLQFSFSPQNLTICTLLINYIRG